MAASPKTQQSLKHRMLSTEPTRLSSGCLELASHLQPRLHEQQVDDVADEIAFLASERARRIIGASVPANGRNQDLTP